MDCPVFYFSVLLTDFVTKNSVFQKVFSPNFSALLSSVSFICLLMQLLPFMFVVIIAKPSAKTGYGISGFAFSQVYWVSLWLVLQFFSTSLIPLGFHDNKSSNIINKLKQIFKDITLFLS